MKKIFLFLVFSFLIFSCSREEDVSRNNFSGVWSGIYQGSDTGTWRVNVAEDGSVTGWTRRYTGTQFIVSGSVDPSGNLSAVIGNSGTGGEFKGTLRSDNTCSGTWKNITTTPVMNGNWNGSKE